MIESGATPAATPLEINVMGPSRAQQQDFTFFQSLALVGPG
jgi:hypothetical protein